MRWISATALGRQKWTRRLEDFIPTRSRVELSRDQTVGLRTGEKEASPRGGAQLLHTKERAFDPTKPKSVQSISLLAEWAGGFNHRPLSIGSITQRLHYGHWLLCRGQRSELSQ